MKNDVHVFIQVRTSSSRLPAKALLTMGSYPLAVLAFKRASNTGLNTKILTSNDLSDDPLCEVLDSYKVPYHRGSLDNVLSRFDKAVANLKDDAIIIRLTGDNVLPDGPFLDKAIQFYIDNSCEYLCSSESLPYGLSVEIFKKYMLDESIKNDSTKYNQEHVTPYIRNTYKQTLFTSTEYECRKRVTIDYFDDYTSMLKVFLTLKNSVEDNAVDILKKIEDRSDSLNRIIVGGAQLGSNYGISNEKELSREMSLGLLREAKKLGVEFVDTASGYGDSELIVGEFLKVNNLHVITKLSPILSEDEGDLYISLVNSIKNLGIKRIHTLMFHRVKHILEYNGKLLNILERLKKEGKILRIGVSVQGPEEFIALKDYFSSLDVIQLPYNIFDYRWNDSKVISLLNEFVNAKEIHIRSSYLQGLIFLKDEKKWPKLDGDYSAGQIILFLEKLSEKYKTSIQSIALHYVLRNTWTSKVVLGFNDCSQLKETQEILNNEIIVEEDDIVELRKLVPINLLNPAKWRTNG